MRHQRPFPDGPPHPEKSALFLHLNTNKQSVTINIEEEEAREILQRLVAECDIVIESYKPGTLESLGLGFDALRRVRPNLVMTSITPFGQTGPHKDYEYTELTIFAMGGAMYREGVPDREPLRYGGEISQYYARLMNGYTYPIVQAEVGADHPLYQAAMNNVTRYSISVARYNRHLLGIG